MSVGISSKTPNIRVSVKSPNEETNIRHVEQSCTYEKGNPVAYVARGAPHIAVELNLRSGEVAVPDASTRLGHGTEVFYGRLIGRWARGDGVLVCLKIEKMPCKNGGEDVQAV